MCCVYASIVLIRVPGTGWGLGLAAAGGRVCGSDMSIKPDTNIGIRYDFTGIWSKYIMGGGDKIKGFRGNYPALRAARGLWSFRRRICQVFPRFVVSLVQPFHMFHLFQPLLKHLPQNETPGISNSALKTFYHPVRLRVHLLIKEGSLGYHPVCRKGRPS